MVGIVQVPITLAYVVPEGGGPCEAPAQFSEISVQAAATAFIDSVEVPFTRRTGRVPGGAAARASSSLLRRLGLETAATEAAKNRSGVVMIAEYFILSYRMMRFATPKRSVATSDKMPSYFILIHRLARPCSAH